MKKKKIFAIYTVIGICVLFFRKKDETSYDTKSEEFGVLDSVYHCLSYQKSYPIIESTALSMSLLECSTGFSSRGDKLFFIRIFGLWKKIGVVYFRELLVYGERNTSTEKAKRKEIKINHNIKIIIMIEN